MIKKSKHYICHWREGLPDRPRWWWSLGQVHTCSWVLYAPFSWLKILLAEESWLFIGFYWLEALKNKNTGAKWRLGLLRPLPVVQAPAAEACCRLAEGKAVVPLSRGRSRGMHTACPLGSGAAACGCSNLKIILWLCYRVSFVFPWHFFISLSYGLVHWSTDSAFW